MSNTGERIKKARKEAGLTQKDLADKIGVTPQMISLYETGKRTPKVESAKKIADAINEENEEPITNAYELLGFFTIGAIQRENERRKKLIEAITKPQRITESLAKNQRIVAESLAKNQRIVAEIFKNNDPVEEDTAIDDWTEEELEEIEKFKDYIRSKRKEAKK